MHKHISGLQIISSIFRILWILSLIISFIGVVMSTQAQPNGMILIAGGLYNAVIFFLINTLLNYLCRMGEMLDTIARYAIKNNDLLEIMPQAQAVRLPINQAHRRG